MKYLYAGLLVAAVTTATITGPATAQQTIRDPAQGQSLFRTYCASCHGAGADGTGPMVGALAGEPADLTRLKADNDGIFPLVRVIRQIDGRDPLVAHGSPMPVFGGFFEGRDVALKTSAGQPILTSMPVADIVGWLETVQR
jgi:mono/diheme cytochrome c family protein